MTLSRYLGPQIYMWTVNLWDPQYDMALTQYLGALGPRCLCKPSICGTLSQAVGPQYDRLLVGVGPSVFIQTMDLWNMH